MPIAAVHAEDVAPGPAAPVSRPPLHRAMGRTPAQVLEDRVRALAHELDLDKKQQAEVREILLRERLAILGLRNGKGVQDMVAASHAIVARTREAIRGVLHDEQRRKYIVDVPESNLAPAQADVKYWLEKTRRPAPAPQDGTADESAAPRPSH